jgi:hypothetical protein
MFQVSAGFPKDVPLVEVRTTTNRGFTPEELSQQCVDSLMNVSDSAPPAIRDQAQAFKERLRHVVELYMHQVVKSDRTTVCNAINEAGQRDLAELIRRL